MRWGKRIPLDLILHQGLATAGLRSRIPVSGQTKQKQVWFKDLQRMWTPRGSLTAEKLGTHEMNVLASFVNSLVLAYLDRGSLSEAAGILATSNYDQADLFTMGPLTETWSSVGAFETAGGAAGSRLTDATTIFDWTQWGPRLILGSQNPYPLWTWDGQTHGEQFAGRDVAVFRHIIQAPRHAPAVNNIWSGPLSGTYKYVFTKYRSWDGAESGPSHELVLDLSTNSPEIIPPHQADSDILNWNAADALRIYRTTSGGALFQLVGVVPNVSSLDDRIFIDNVPDSALGDAMNTIEAMEDLRARAICEHGDRIYLFNTIENGEHAPGRIRWSEAGYPSIFNALEFTEEEIDGDLVAGVSHRLGVLAFTTAQTYLCVPRGGGSHEVRPMSGWPGAVGTRAVAALNGVPGGGVAWVSESGISVVDDFLRYRRISSPELDGIFRFAPHATTEKAVVFAAPRHGAVGAALPSPEDPEQGHDILLLPLTEGGSWGHTTDAVQDALAVTHPDGRRLVLKHGNAGAGQTYTGYLFEQDPGDQSKAIIGPTDFDIPGKKRFRSVTVYIEIHRALRVSLRVYFDGEQDATSKSQTIDLGGNPMPTAGTWDLFTDGFEKPAVKQVKLCKRKRFEEMIIEIICDPTVSYPVGQTPWSIKNVRVSVQREETR